MITYAKSNIGYSHIKNHMPCQDHTSSFKDNTRTIITCADGHGGDAYVRSQCGSLYASLSCINTFLGVSPYELSRNEKEDIEKRIKLSILCDWNRFVEKSLSNRSLSSKEMVFLDDEKKERLRMYPTKAYGTTLSGALLLGNKLIVASIGDTECFLLKKGELIRAFNTDDDPAANVTYSMCQEDAFKYMRVSIFDFNEYDAVILMTDGLSSPYQTYDNLNNSLLKPMMKDILETKSTSFLDPVIERIAEETGIGDDVSISFIINDEKAKAKYYLGEE